VSLEKIKNQNMQKLTFTLLCFVFIAQNVFAQLAEKRIIPATRTTGKITIDGILDEPEWKNAPAATDFVFSWPTPGKKATQKTVARIVYDDFALYVSAYCYDTKADSIAKVLNKRDDTSNSDFFGFLIDTYKDGQNAVEFDVTPANIQRDVKYSLANASNNGDNSNGEDANWDAVWKSSTKIMPDGYVVEMEIPYAAIRFPKQAEQTWHLNFFRRIFRLGENESWNTIKAEESGMIRQSGLFTGIKNIKAPLRLSVTPFLSLYGENYHDKDATQKNVNGFSYNAGMDLKYGINEAFTLDATIIPDFGQVRSDNRVVNLTPFEVRFDENRPFFMEGTELFNKGGLFYSRRIGGTPINYYGIENQLNDNETLTKNPSKGQLYNTTKISGRTTKGTGVGVLNAVQAATFATAQNNENGSERQIQSSPLTNYNVFVIDQNLKNNSSIALTNTNVMRSGSTYDANVSNINFNLKNKKNSYGISGNFALSQLFKTKETNLGHKANIDFSKLNGKTTWGLSYSEISNGYNQNDLGYQQSYNERNYNVWGGYNEYEAKGKKFNNYWVNTWAWYGTLQERNAFTSAGVGLNVGGNTKNFHNMGINLNLNFLGSDDYFEPRTYDFISYYHVPAYVNSNIWYNSDRRKKWRVFGGAWIRTFGNERFASNLWGGFSYQVNSKFKVSIDFTKETTRNDIGYTGKRSKSSDIGLLQQNATVFGKRNVNGFDNGLNFTYTFNNKANLAFRLRHYWQQVDYASFYTLQKDGNVQASSYRGLDKSDKSLHNINANYVNIDCVFTWRFAPGSDFLLTWKNAIYSENSDLENGYIGNARNVFSNPQTNSLNLKVLYFLDYTETKKKFAH
jgi:Domain of unknown function (DUF5916)/Carbohydrate family 9 binding domain-like